MGCVGRATPVDPLLALATLRAEIPLVAVGAGPGERFERDNPWIFHCPANDPARHEMLLDYVFDHLKLTRVAILRSAGGVAQTHLDWWARHARRREHRPVADLFFHPKATNLATQIQALRRAKPEAVLTWCGAEMSAAISRRLREADLRVLFVGSDRIVSESFVELAGDDVGEVIAIPPCRHRQDIAGQARFIEEFSKSSRRENSGRRPSATAFFAYDAARHLLETASAAGAAKLSGAGSAEAREIVRAELAKLQEPSLARLQGGQWKILGRTEPRP